MSPATATSRTSAALRAAAPAALALLAVGGLGAADGGYRPAAWGWATLAFLWAALAALLLRPRVELSRREAAAIVLLAALVAWTALSALWSWSVPLSLLDAHRSLLYLAGLAALLLVGTRASAGWLAGAVLLATAAVATANLAHRLRGTGPLAGEESLPIGYANGLGLLGAIGVVLGVGLAWGARRPAALAAAAAAVPAAAVLLLSGSRGAWLAAAVALAALAALRRGPAAAFPLVVGGGAAAAVALAYARGSERERYWTVALGQAESAPLVGTGAGTFARAWLRDRPEALGARDAHGLYVETLGELGIVGLALLLALLAIPVAAAVAARADAAAAAGGAAYAAFLVGAGVDWHWELPAVTLGALACAAAPLLAGRSGDVVAGARGRAVAVGAVAAAAAVAFASLVGHSSLDEGAAALRAGDPASAERLAARAARALPWAAEPWRLAGEARAAAGRTDAARASFRRALRRDPGDPELWRLLARVSEGEERRRAVRRAALLDPLG